METLTAVEARRRDARGKGMISDRTLIFYRARSGRRALRIRRRLRLLLTLLSRYETLPVVVFLPLPSPLSLSLLARSPRLRAHNF